MPHSHMHTQTDLMLLDAVETAERIRRGELQPLDAVDAAIARIEASNPTLNAVVTTRFEQARAEATSPDLPDGPFRGVPYLLKDLDVVSAGDPFHAGMQVLKDLDWHADHDSFFVARLRQAGFIILGKTNTPEIGLNVTTEPRSYGAARNPWNTAHSTGGSSGGSAAAVAAGMVPAAHASDGGGSIRIPASECGLVGLKPSRGRVSLGPDHGEYWHGLVTSHAVTRTVRDSAALLDIVAGTMPGDPYTAPPPTQPYLRALDDALAPLRVGVLTHIPSGLGPVHADCVTAVQHTGQLLTTLGHHVDACFPEALGEVEIATQYFPTLVTSWTARTLSLWSQRIGRTLGAEDVEPGTWMFAEMGQQVSATEYLHTVDHLHGYTRRVAQWWADGYDLLLTPTLPEPPPLLGALMPTADDPLTGMMRNAAMIPFTMPFNITGQPAISLPLHRNDAGLPIGVQLVAAYGREDVLLQVARQLEQASPRIDIAPCP